MDKVGHTQGALCKVGHAMTSRRRQQNAYMQMQVPDFVYAAILRCVVCAGIGYIKQIHFESTQNQKK
jgi:hypothetical protein